MGRSPSGASGKKATQGKRWREKGEKIVKATDPKSRPDRGGEGKKNFRSEKEY